MAAAVLATVAAAGAEPVHLVGHSMGAGVAAALALAAPARVASLVLIAPGGVSPAIDADLLARFAEARDAATVGPLIAAFFAPGARIPPALPRLTADGKTDDHVDGLRRTLAGMLDAGGQRVIDLDALAATGVPVRVLWGEADRIFPIEAAAGLPGVFALHRFPGVGHMPHVEVPRETIRIIQETIRGA
jgi:pyruvate dehydrogenase E2 component (dihydrolipoamide acetyltransferase)